VETTANAIVAARGSHGMSARFYSSPCHPLSERQGFLAVRNGAAKP